MANTPLKRAAARAALSKNATSSSKKSPKNARTTKKRVTAKKTTFRTSKRGKNNEEDQKSVEEEEEMEEISLGSAESVNKKSGKTTKSKAGKANKKSVANKKATKKRETVESAASAAPIASPSKTKIKTGRPKSKKVLSEILIKKYEPSSPSSPVKKNHNGRPPRAVKHFIGGQKHALLAKKIFTDPSLAVNQRPQAIVIERAVFEPERSRRPRVSWSLDEVENLRYGIKKHGEGFWSDILNDPELSFNPSRSQIDIKDKWRNLTAYVEYKAHPMRRFVLVDSTHQMIRSSAGNLHVFNNRWPRDAALKAATKDEFYPVDENNERSTSAIIHIKELLDQESKRDRPEIVHVYRITRLLERPKSLKKFDGYAAVWSGKVEKVAEEILVRQEEVLSPEDEKLIEIQRKQEEMKQGQ